MTKDNNGINHTNGEEHRMPVDFEFVTNYHWDLGHGWSEELL